MATAITTKPAPPHQKIKRPPPLVQTGVNGAKSSQSSPSPSLSSKRPPSSFKQPSITASSSVSNVSVNGGVSRQGNRRRESQKPGDATGRQVRVGKNGQAEGADRKSLKRKPEPYVKTAQYILKKFRNCPPSLILHLHPTHFRFDQQDGSFSYNSPMKFILEHIKLQTVPHDMMEELTSSGVKFYEGCLIIQIHDHTSTSSTASSNTSNSAGDKIVPFSIHNFSEHLTPSPYVPYPQASGVSDSTDGKKAPVGGGSSNEPAKNASQPTGSTEKQVSKGPKIFTAVLMPTPLSLREEIFIFANTPDPRSNNRKHSQSSISRTPASATIPHPPTPLSAIPLTPSTSGPPTKKVKMLLGENNIGGFESAAIAAMAAPLFLEPVRSLEDSQRILEKLSDPLHQENYPAPKTRKRTVAELAADEALAAQEQRFMLIMDERLAPSTSTGGSSGKPGTADGETGAASFEPRFERFKTLEALKVNLRERQQREHDAKAQQQAQVAAAKAKQERHDQDNLRLAQEQKAAENARREQELRKYQAQQAQIQNQANLVALQQQQQQQHLAASQNQIPHSSSSNGLISNVPQNMLPASQTHHASPIVRNSTPHSNSSPSVGNSMVGIPGPGVTMNRTASGQGNASSPARPSSALQHAHPGNGISMVHQRSQQPPSRRGTPQMANGTPRMQSVTPVVNSVTPTPRMGHASPPSTMSHTPVINQNPIAQQHLVGGQQPQLTPQQQQQIVRQQQQQQAYIQQQQHQQQQQQLQNSPNLQMSPDRSQMQTQQRHAHELYQQQIRNQHQQMNGASPPLSQAPNQQVHMQQPHPSQPQGQPPPNPQQRPQGNNQTIQSQLQQLQQRYFNTQMRNLVQHYNGQVPPEKIQSAKDQSRFQAQHFWNNQRNQAIQRQQQQQQQLGQQQAMMTRLGQMGQAGQIGQMNQMGQMGPIGQIPQMGQMGQMGQMNQMNQMGQISQMNGGMNGGMGGMGPMQ